MPSDRKAMSEAHIFSAYFLPIRISPGIHLKTKAKAFDTILSLNI
jgi:hypothetical protein